MITNEPIHIEYVGNGFIVRPQDSWWRFRPHDDGVGNLSAAKEVMVFQTYMELSQWLALHFDYRNDLVLPDVAPDDD